MFLFADYAKYVNKIQKLNLVYSCINRYINQNTTLKHLSFEKTCRSSVPVEIGCSRCLDSLIELYNDILTSVFRNIQSEYEDFGHC